MHQLCTRVHNGRSGLSKVVDFGACATRYKQ